MEELATPPTAYTSINGSKLRIAKGGKMVPLHTVLEIKTRTMRKPLAIRDVAPQLWISQTPNLVRAHHNYGEFDKAQTENVAAQIEEWENENEPALEKLGWLIKQITAIAKDCGGQAKVEYDPQGNRLVVSPDCGKRMLPADLYSKWNIESSYREPETAIIEHGGAEFTAEVKETRN
ncbi:geranylgeranyl pyrophosphate synthetase [Beauveria brongniartii RCEF 3172]|uniref:Geranylgeranyl pyrophosphate synthetase n=1 Tax=Beauveria brongniartii RCEF 3172 TaxID=1081107 RepID=A0A169YFP2_9HYPO|nr:geranylgeranyl pyrophosphate synthetase [Beauveria brongniartii RCEF 3172]